MKGNGEQKVKASTICPKCKSEFILELTEDKKVNDVICPECLNKFSIDTKCESKELDWQEYGEPRKTILSCIKPRSNKPLIAVILLVCVFLIGISTAVSYVVFIQTTSYAISFMDFFKDNINVAHSIIIVIFSIPLQ